MDQDNLPPSILEQTKDVRLSPDILLFMGKKAASLHESRGVPLTDAVITAIGNELLSPHHIRRVCEFANQQAFRQYWDRGGAVRNIEFPGGPADPSTVMIELHKGAREMEEPMHSDYLFPPPTQPIGAIEEEIFGRSPEGDDLPGRDSEKDDILELERLRMQNSDASSQAENEIERLLMEESITKDELRRDFAQALMEGEGVGKIASAWRLMGPSRDSYVSALAECADEMLGRNCLTYEQFTRDLEKTASSIFPNPENPCVKTFAKYASIKDDLSYLLEAKKTLDDQGEFLSKTLEQIKTAGTGLEVGKTVAKGLGGAAKAYLGIGAQAAETLANAGVTSKAALTAAKFAPHALAAYGAKKYYDTSPRLQMAVWNLKNRLAGGGGDYGYY
jgi:hypothetical protein